MKQELDNLAMYESKKIIVPRLAGLIRELYDHYVKALAKTNDWTKKQRLFETLIDLIAQQIQHPYKFAIFHQAIRYPFDYYQFGIDFIRPFIDFERSKVMGITNLTAIRNNLSNKENVILLANHQIEPDPQTISLLLEKIDPELAEKIIFVAGARVTSDPMAIPMSMGRNLLCIYSKKHMTGTAEERQTKILHNQRTMKKMVELLQEGGHCIFVAPSGGRDRPNIHGKVEVASFDPQSIEFFWLMAQQARNKTHFYPLALRTYDLMPPPSNIEKTIGEKRIMAITPIYLAFGEEVNMNYFPGSEHLDKQTKRNKRAEYIYNIVKKDYDNFSTLAL